MTITTTELSSDSWGWECDECGSMEFTSTLTEQDLEWLSCTGCGGYEFHKEDK